MKLLGISDGSPASLEVSGDTLVWRATRDGAADNVATTVHDIKDVTWFEKKWSAVGIGIALGGVLWSIFKSPAIGAVMFAIGLALAIRVFTRPTRLLALACGDRRLLLEVEAASAAGARELAERIEHVRHTGGAPDSPPTLP